MKQKSVKVGLMLFLIACGSDDAGEMLEDAGQMMVDAGREMRDATADAQVTPEGEVLCEETFTRRSAVTETPAIYIETIEYYARMPVADTSNIVAVSTRLCGREVFGTDPAIPTCEMNRTCTGVTAPATDCVVTAGADIGADYVRVHCGTRVVRTGTTSRVESGARRTKVRIALTRG